MSLSFISSFESRTLERKNKEKRKKKKEEKKKRKNTYSKNLKIKISQTHTLLLRYHHIRPSVIETNEE